MGTVAVGSGVINFMSYDMGFQISTSGIYYYDAGTLFNIVDKATQVINFRIGTSYDFIPASGLFVTDPPRDIQTLIALQGQCLITKRELNLAMDKGIRVRQDDNEVDTASSLGPRLLFAKQGVCRDVQALINDYMLTQALNEGSVIWEGTKKLWQAVDFSGTGADTINAPHNVY